MKYIVSYSGGAGSWGAARRLIEKHGKDDVILVFMDTNSEDADLYRFLWQSVRHLSAEFVYLADGRDIWQVFKDKRFVGNSRIDPCSQILKRELFKRWLSKRYKPPFAPPNGAIPRDQENARILYEADNREAATICLGIDWTEAHRLDRSSIRYAPYPVEAPLCDEPYLSKLQVIADIRECGIEPPRLYDMGFNHNNCSGFCVKAGKAQFKRLLITMPEVYAYHENREQELRDYLGKDVSVMSEVVDGKKRPLTMREFRHRQREGRLYIDEDDWGGCGCFVD